jgi:5'-nucleotidase
LRILVTNDDGIHAEGLAVLERIALALTDDVWICAPEYEQSGMSRALTLAEPIRVRQLEPRRFAITGTPTDCVMLGVRELVGDRRPDLVLSGVNHGANMAEDVTMSGTIAGAIEAMALGVPGIALSQMGRAGQGPDFTPAETLGPGIVKRLMELGWRDDVVMNVNFPNRPVAAINEVEVTRQGLRGGHRRHPDKRTDPRGKTYYWVGYTIGPFTPEPGTDLRAVEDGKISVTPLHIDLTHTAAMHDLKKLLGGSPPKA